MGLLTDEEGNPRWRAGGVVLVLVLALMLLPPLLRNKEISHPRSAEQQVDLCALLPDPPAPLQDPTRQRVGNGFMCELKAATSDARLTVGMTTTRDVSAGGGRQRTSAVYSTWLKEVVASGATDVRELPGEWAMASSYRDRQNNHILVEDHGVMLTLFSNRLDGDQLAAYARSVTARLRKP